MSDDDDDDSLMEDFLSEAAQLLEEAEESLLCIEKNEDIDENFNSVYRAFHSLKGAAGMMGLVDVQGHMHHMEDHFDKLRGKEEEIPSKIDYFLRGIDAGRTLMDGGSIEFDYDEIDASGKQANSDTQSQSQEQTEEVISQDEVSSESVNNVEQQAEISSLEELVGECVDLLMYQYGDLDDFLEANGKADIQNEIKNKMTRILNAKQRLL